LQTQQKSAATHYGLAPSFVVFGYLRKVWVKERLEKEREKEITLREIEMTERKRKYYYNEQ
jgi:hypothetical protein